MSYNSRHWHDHADDVDSFRKKEELLDEEAESRTLHIEFDVLYQYYEDKVKVTLTSVEFDGELTFETTTGNKARQAIDDLEQEKEEEKKPEPPKAVPPPYTYTPPRPPQSQPQQTSRPVQPQPQQTSRPVQPQPQPQTKTVDVHEQVQRQVEGNNNPLFDIATDIAEILKLGAQLKPKVDKLRKR